MNRSPGGNINRSRDSAPNSPSHAQSSLNHSNGKTYAEIEPRLKDTELYELEWIELYTELAPSDDLKELRRMALSLGFKAKKFRSLYWALLLDVLGRNPYHWLDERRTARNHYAVLKEQYNRNPYQMTHNGQKSEEPEVSKTKVVSDDPLSQNEGSVWHQHFCDLELTKLINQDVTRTFPGMEFFRQPELQTTMANILFCYARSHPHICYRQGMHELLAPLLFVMHSDHHHMWQMKRTNNCINPTMFEMLDPDYTEADAYCLFTKLMQRMEVYYKIRNVVPNASGELPRQSGSKDPKSPSSATDDLDAHIRWMRANVLSRHDPHLEEHLTRLNIPLSVIGIRWYRLLFGREFSFCDLLTLWDAIFADKFELIKYLPAAMLVSVRRTILTSDFIGVYECLMNFQDAVEIRPLIKYSLYLQDERKYKRPEGFFVPVPVKQIRKIETSNFIPRCGTLPSRGNPKRSPKPREVQRPRANSLKRLTTVNAAAVKPNSSDVISADKNDLGISEGYLEDDPAVLKMNVDYMARVMAISRLKLQQYVTGLKENLRDSENPKVQSCLDGLEELCAFMEPRQSAGNRNRNRTAPAGQLEYLSPPVERAYVADETFQGTDLTSTPKSSNGGGGGAITKTMSQPEVKAEFVRTLRDCDMVGNAPVVTVGSFLNESNRRSSFEVAAASSYEFPEHRIPRMAQKVIGNRKEVELLEIVGGNEGRDFQVELGMNGSQRGDFVPSRDPQMERQDSSSS